MLLRTKIAWEEFEGVEEKGIGHFPVPRTITLLIVSSDNEFHLHENKKSFSYLCLNARAASGGWVPGRQGLQLQSNPKAEEHPQAY